MKRFGIVFLLVVLILSGCVAKPKDIKSDDTESTESVQHTPTSEMYTPARTIAPTIMEVELEGSAVTAVPEATPKPETMLKELPKLIENDVHKYNETIKKVNNSRVHQIKVYDVDGERIEGSVYKYNNEYFVISKDRRGFIAEYNNSLDRYEAKQILPNVDTYKAQIYFESGFSLRYTSNTIEVWKLGKRTDFVETEWAKYLKNFDGNRAGNCLNDAKFPYYFRVGENRIYFFRFFVDGKEVRLDDLIAIEAEYYANYKNCIFYKQGSCVYIFNGFDITKAVDAVKSMNHDKKTFEPIISLENGKTVYGNEFL